MSLTQSRSMGAGGTRAASAAVSTWSYKAGVGSYNTDACSNTIHQGVWFSSNFTLGIDKNFGGGFNGNTDIAGGIFDGGIASTADGINIIGVDQSIDSAAIKSTTGGLSSTTVTLTNMVAFKRVFYLNNTFIITYTNGSSSWGFYYSTDSGANWTNIVGSGSIAWASATNSVRYAGYVNGQYWFTLSNGTTYSTSTAVTSWSSAGTGVWSSTNFQANTNNVVYSGTTYIATTDSASATGVSAATTLGTWVSNTSGIGTTRHTMTAVGSSILVVGINNVAKLITGVSGTTLTFGSGTTVATTGALVHNGVVNDGTRFGLIAVSGTNLAKIYYSTDNVTWTIVSPTASPTFPQPGSTVTVAAGQNGSKL